MIRKLIVLVAMFSFLFTAGASHDAEAQCTSRYNDVIVDATGCANYPTGGLGSSAPTAVPTATPRPTSSAVVSADTVDATTGGTSGGASIAFTGSESRALGYAGASLIGFGAIALAVARRKTDTDLD